MHTQHGTASPYTTGLIQGWLRLSGSFHVIGNDCWNLPIRFGILQSRTWWQDEASQQAQGTAAADPPLNTTVEQLMGSGAYQGFRSNYNSMINF